MIKYDQKMMINIVFLFLPVVADNGTFVVDVEILLFFGGETIGIEVDDDGRGGGVGARGGVERVVAEVLPFD